MSLWISDFKEVLKGGFNCNVVHLWTHTQLPRLFMANVKLKIGFFIGTHHVKNTTFLVSFGLCSN